MISRSESHGPDLERRIRVEGIGTMLTAEGCAARRERLWGALPSPCDVLIVGDPSHLIYFAGYCAVAVRVPDGRVGGPAPAGAGPGDAGGRRHARAVSSSGASSTSGSRRSGTTASIRPRIAGASSSSRRSAAWRRCPGRRVGVELAGVPAGVVEGLRAARPGLEIVDIGPLIRPLRRSKDPDEIDDAAPIDARRRSGPGGGPGEGPAGDDRARRLPDRPERGR